MTWHDTILTNTEILKQSIYDLPSVYLVIKGAAAGGFNGFYNGIRDSTVKQLAGPAKRTQ